MQPGSSGAFSDTDGHNTFVGGQGALRNQGGGYGEAGSSGGVGPGGGMPRRPVSMSTGNLVDLYESAAAERGGGGGGMAGLRGVASSSNLWDQQVSHLSLRCVWRWGHGLRYLEAATAYVCARRTRASSCNGA